MGVSTPLRLTSSRMTGPTKKFPPRRHLRMHTPIGVLQEKFVRDAV